MGGLVKQLEFHNILQQSIKHIIKNIVILIGIAMFFSCETSFNEIDDLLADKNLPIAVTKNISLVFTDKGKVKNKLKAPLLYDFENRKKQPYKEFPNGIQVTTFDKEGDSTTITAKYAISYSKTEITEIREDVIVFNHTKNLTLKTNLLYWDQKENYFFSNKKSILTTPKDTIVGLEGFDSNADLTNTSMINNSGTLYVNEN